MRILKPEECKVSGFLASGIRCGIKKKEGSRDLALMYSETDALAAGVFTKNSVKAAPVLLDMERIGSGKGRAIIVNSGNANACTGADGMLKARETSKRLAGELKIQDETVYVSSTGVIGEPLPVDKIISAIPELVRNLRSDGWMDAEEAIMTTDAFPKMVGVEFKIGEKKVAVMGIAKGAGMVHPDMATMLSYIVTDCAMESRSLERALKKAVDRSFNKITVDGDMSTNDTVIILSNGQAGNLMFHSRSDEMERFQEGLDYVALELARMIVRDGEGATKIIEISVRGAESNFSAEQIAYAIGRSSLVKTAFFGMDPNWGRIMAAMGATSRRFNPDRVDIYFNDLQVVQDGLSVGGDWDVRAREVMKLPEVKLSVDLKMGSSDCTIWASDLSTDYVKLNASYRS